MEEDVGAKAPVTRLRRRLSVEQSEEVKSPSAPSTPSKKRGGRLAAKPQLELIDENALENAPKRQTKKSAAKDVIEATEEKVLTPSRRSTRIKSNTSIVSDTPQSFDSPRAKRAAKRNSQIGSDNEAPLTPVRQTRRTRKDSTSSIDKQENTSAKKPTIIADSIIEEVETNSQKSVENENSEITPKRMSPRLQKKNKKGDTDTETEDIRQKNNNTPDISKTSKNKISDDSFKLINSLDDRPVNKTQINNSASFVTSKKTRRNRTNTWTAAQNDNSDEQNNLVLEEKADDNDNNTVINKDNQDTSSNKINDEIEEGNKDLFNSSKSKMKRNSVSSDSFHKVDQISLDKSNVEKTPLSNTNDTEIPEKTVMNETEKLFEKPPVTAVQSLIYFDDSDSDSRGKPVSDKPGDNEDQCVPVVPEINQKSVHGSILNQNENTSNKVSYNDTCEPMDIDETMPTNVSLINSSNSNQDKDTHEILEKSKDQKLNSGENIKSPNKSQRDSTSLLSTSQNIDRTGNENKSTLILCQLKDESTTDNSLTKSPAVTQLKDISTNDKSVTKSPKATIEVLSKSVTDMNKDKVIDKKDSLNYMTSTPLQQKNLKKMTMQINTSIINDSNNGSIQQSSAKKNKSNISKQSNRSAKVSSSEESDSENVSTKDKSDFLDDEAEEASDDYESGDSQDDEERQYAEENEILEKGETLDSDDDCSNDTDYENDSFVVSSNEEDNELLTGSGDDLSMSDNELTMSKKSKKKFDARKSKEQKKASKEMYEARHNISNNSSKAEITHQKKNKRQRLNSSALQSEEEIAVKSKKNKRMKIDSSQDSNTEDIEVDSKETKTNVSMGKEFEITTVCDESIMNKNDPLSMNIKTEPQTPLKNLDISTVPILDKIEEVQMNQNATIMKSNDTSDPLEEDSDASSISENMEISANYDSVLKELNKEVENKKIKSLDMSLNVNKKTKKIAKDPIVDNLNLTNTKKSKRDSNIDKTQTDANTSQKLNSSSRKVTKGKGEFDESSSDSIDLQLLFSGDSSDSINKISKSKQEDQKEPESFIPLKRTEAKTNILQENSEDIDRVQKPQEIETSTTQLQGALNTSTKKHKKKDRLSMSEDTHNITANPDISLNSKFDTSSKKKKNSLSDGEIDPYVSLNESRKNISINTTLTNSKKKEKNSLSVSDGTSEKAYDDKTSNSNLKLQEPSQNETVHDISMKRTLNTSTKNENDSISVSDDISVPKDVDANHQNISQDENYLNQSVNISAKKKKKKNSISVSDEAGDVKINNTTDVNKHTVMQNEIDPDQSINTSTKVKNKKNSISVSYETKSDEAVNQDGQVVSQMDHNNSLNNTLNTSSKKKKKKHNISVTDELYGKVEEIPINTEPELNVSLNNEDLSMNTTLNTSSKKKKKKNSLSVSEDMGDKNNISITDQFSNISYNKSSLDMSTNSAITTSSKKKKKNSISSEFYSEHNVIEVNTTRSDSNDLDKSSNELAAGAKKKKKHNDSVVANFNLTSTSVNEKDVSLTTSAKKKKNTTADLQDIVKDSQDGDSDAPEEVPYTSHKNTSVDTSGGAHIFIDTEGNQDWNTLITSGSSKKKNKKKKELQETQSAVNEIIENNTEKSGTSKKRKRKSSSNSTSQDAVTADFDQKPLNDSVYLENKRKKQKTSLPEDFPADIKDSNKKQNKKRKERDDDDPTITSKILKQNSSDKLSVPRLPSTILNQLEDKPRKEVLEKRKAIAVSTAQFIVEEAQKRKNKPSNYLEESVYLNDSIDEKKQKGFIKVPKVLPFVPTATISGSGFTTKFQINVLAKETKFVAQTSNMAGFKNEYLGSKKIKKAGTYEMYKSVRNRKMSKF